MRLRRLGVFVFALAMLASSVVPAIARDATPASGTPLAGTPMVTGPHVIGLGQADVSRAAAALLAVQAADGGFYGMDGKTEDPGTTIDALQALAAARHAGAETGDGIDRALGYLMASGEAYATKGNGPRAKLVLAVEAAGQDAASFGGQDLWAPIQDGADTSGNGDDGSFNLALIVLAAVAVDSDRTGELAEQLMKSQLGDGSWEFGAGQGGDTNTTALAIQALVGAGGVNETVIQNGMTYLESARANDGGYAYSVGKSASDNVADANSTALVLQARIAAGVPGNDASFLQDAAVLGGFQNASGLFRYADAQPDDNVFATVQALPAIAGFRYPIQPS